MSSFDWESFLRQWSQAILESMSEDQQAQLPQDVIESRWLGYAGATEEQICQAESRLGVKLPPSYREFLLVTNGWRQTTPFIRKLWSTEGIERFAARHHRWIEAFTSHHENTQVSFEYAIELDELWEPPSVADEEYFVYGEEQDCSKLRVEYLKTAIEISDVGEASIYLLNPQVVTEAGEWEAWFFGDWLPGADRYPSFREMMVAEYHNFLELQDSPSTPPSTLPSTQGEPFPEPEPAAIAEPLVTGDRLSPPPEMQGAAAFIQETASPGLESVPEAKPVVWRSLKRLLVEFQSRQIGERLEYRTVTIGSEQKGCLSGLGERKLRQWLQEQVASGISRPVNSLATSATSVSEAAILNLEPPLPIPPELPEPDFDLTPEIDQLTIRQDACLSDPIIVSPSGLKQAKKPGYASLTSQQPFSLEVVFKLLGQSISDLSTQPVTCQAQFHAQNRITGKWIVLGTTRPNALVSDRRTYTAYLFGNTLEPGMYRLQVLTTLRGSTASLTSFELPLLNVV
ncbi:MAG: SMI1/KNR4 family protein [Kovacikia sp.]